MMTCFWKLPRRLRLYHLVQDNYTCWQNFLCSPNPNERLWIYVTRVFLFVCERFNICRKNICVKLLGQHKEKAHPLCERQQSSFSLNQIFKMGKHGWFYCHCWRCLSAEILSNYSKPHMEPECATPFSLSSDQHLVKAFGVCCFSTIFVQNVS